MSNNKCETGLSTSHIDSILKLCNQISVGLHVEPDDIHIIPLLAGLDGEIYRVNFKHDQFKPVVIKYFRDNFSEYDRTRHHAKISALVLGEHGLAPKVHLLTNEAMVFEFIEGHMLTAHDDYNEATFRQMARKLSQMHQLTVPIVRNDLAGMPRLFVVLDTIFPRNQLESQLYTGKTREAMMRLQCDYLLNHNLIESIDSIRTLITRDINATWPIVFVHGDLSHFNILVDPQGEIRFIDFDVTCYQYRGYDFGRYLGEYGCSNLFEEVPRISEEKLIQFAQEYLEEGARIRGDEFRRNPSNTVEHLLKEIKLFIPFAHLVCAIYCLWRVLKNEKDCNEYLNYAEIRYKQFIECKERYENGKWD